MAGNAESDAGSGFRKFLEFLEERIESCKRRLYCGDPNEMIRKNLLDEAKEKWLAFSSSRPSIHGSEEEMVIVHAIVDECVDYAECYVEAVKPRISNCLCQMHMRGLLWMYGDGWPSELEAELKWEFSQIGFDHNPIKISRECLR